MSNKPFKILYVDDEELNLLNLRLNFQEEYEILIAQSGQEGLDLFTDHDDIGLVISDHRMPGMTGVEMLSEMYRLNPDPGRIIITAYSEAENVIEAINRGQISQYIIKPWNRIDLKLVIDQARSAYDLRRENRLLTLELAKKNENLEEVNKKILVINEVLKADIRRRQSAEQGLKESEEKFRMFTHASQDMIFLFDVNGTCLYCNPTVEKVLGYQVEKLLGTDLSFAIYPDNISEITGKIGELLKGEEAPDSLEIPILQADGDYLPAEVNLFSFVLAKGERIIGSIVRDISKRKEDEKNLRQSEQRLRELSGALISAQDDERRRLSMELHDEFGQSMAVLKLQISGVKNYLFNTEEVDKDTVVDYLNELRLLVNSLIESTRSLSRDLWPMMVDDLGIDAAFENLASTFLQISDIKTKISTCEIGAFLSVEQQRHVYRVIQESLNNVIKHSHAKNLTVDICHDNDIIQIDIEDDGIGFDVDSVLIRTGTDRGIGLQSITERVQMLEGELHVDSVKGRGTQLKLTLPVSAMNSNNP